MHYIITMMKCKMFYLLNYNLKNAGIYSIKVGVVIRF